MGFVGLRRYLAKLLEAVRGSMPTTPADRRLVGTGGGARGPMDGPGALVLELDLLVATGARVEQGLHEIHSHGGPGPAVVQLATGLLGDEPADVRKDDDHEVAVRPHAEGRA